MTSRESDHDARLQSERHDVFEVLQVTRDTALEAIVGADLVEVASHQVSSTHRHNDAETVLYVLDGYCDVLLEPDREAVAIRAGERVVIAKGVYHAIRTADSPLRFLSVQSPPILDRSTGHLDLEPLPTTDTL